MNDKGNVLITLYYADGLHGGVKYAAEIGEFLISIGYKVFVAGAITSEKIKSYFELKNISYFNLKSVPLDVEYDIVWAHTFPTLPFLIKKGLKYKRIINSCISEFLLLEKPCFLHENIDLILTLTENNRKNILSDYNISTVVKTLPNTAPDNFFEDFPKSGQLNKLAIVSNHPPKELLEAMNFLQKRKVSCVLFGASNKNVVEITPKLLSEFDCVVSIGKTVQYSLAAGIPVYCYDHFGGSGYIVPENLDVEEQSNFSGRSFRTKKSSEQITDEIIEQYENVFAQRNELMKIAEQRYKLSLRLLEVLAFLEGLPLKEKIKIDSENRLYFDYCDHIISSVKERKKRKPFLDHLKHVAHFLYPMKKKNDILFK